MCLQDGNTLKLEIKDKKLRKFEGQELMSFPQPGDSEEQPGSVTEGWQHQEMKSGSIFPCFWLDSQRMSVCEQCWKDQWEEELILYLQSCI